MPLPDNFFDVWKDHYERDPSSFEVFVQETIEQHIISLTDDPEQQLKLKQLQFRIDRILRKYKDPIARMNVMIEMLYNHLDKLNAALNDLRSTGVNIDKI